MTDTKNPAADTAAGARDLLTDHFGRIRELVRSVTDGLSDEAGAYRPDPNANSADWLVWHTIRIQDDHIAHLAGVEQRWTSDGFYDRFGLPFDAKAHGYGHSSAEVGQVRVAADLLDAYHVAVHAATLGYVDLLTAAELTRVVDTRWNPPVTAAVRLVSMIGDCLQHLGQAAYVRGLAERAGLG